MSAYAPHLMSTVFGLVVLCCLGWAVHAAVLARRLARARRDPLTGLYLRGHFVALAVRMLRRRTAVCGLIDVNDFKHINDTYGHAVGDAVLTELARRIRHALPRQAVAGRWGGDELVVVLPPTYAPALTAALRDPVQVSPGGPVRAVQVEISLGWSTPVRSTHGAAEAVLDTALADADTAMYRRKPQRSTQEHRPVPHSARREQRRIHRVLARPTR